MGFYGRQGAPPPESGHPLPCERGPRQSRALLPPHLIGWLVFAEVDENGVAQEAVCRPCQVCDLRDELRLDPMDAGKNQRRPESGRAGRRDIQRRFGAAQRVEAVPQIGKDLDGQVPTRPA